MAVPKQRHTKTRRNNRRMHLFIKDVVLAVCSKCGKKVRPHTICQYCGYYKNIEAVNVLEKLNKKEKKKREKEIAGREKEEKPLNMEELSKK